MKNTKSGSIMRHVRVVAGTYSVEEISECLADQLAGIGNHCIQGEDGEFMIDVLARAGMVRKLIDGGSGIPAAMRELGRRMRRISLNTG